MKALVLGASGFFGGETARRLSEKPIFSEIGLASRSAGKTDALADEIGSKAKTVAVNFGDLESLKRAVAEVDIVVNVTGPALQTSMPGIIAATEVGVHYCDISAEVGVFQQALKYEAEIKSVKNSVLIGAGFHPGITDLLGEKAIAGLDEVSTVELYIIGTLSDYGDAQAMMSVVDAGWEGSEGFKTIFQGVGMDATIVEAGKWVNKSPSTNPRTVKTPDGFEVNVDYFATLEPLALARRYPQIQSCAMNYGIWPLVSHTAVQEHSKHFVEGTYEAGQLIYDLFEGNLNQPSAYPQVQYWASAMGLKDGRKCRATAYSLGDWCSNKSMIATTTGMLACAAEKLASGRVKKQGLLTASDLFDPDEAFQAMAGGEDPQIRVDLRFV